MKKVTVNTNRFGIAKEETKKMSFNTFITDTQKAYEKTDTEIKVGTKVQYKTDDGNVLNLIAVKHEHSELFDVWLCIDPCGHSKNGECTLYNCFADELKLGWTSRVRSEKKVLDELVSKMKKEYLHRVGTQFDNAILEMEKIANKISK